MGAIYTKYVYRRGKGQLDELRIYAGRVGYIRIAFNAGLGVIYTKYVYMPSRGDIHELRLYAE
jgi:hypothetical protein